MGNHLAYLRRLGLPEGFGERTSQKRIPFNFFPEKTFNNGQEIRVYDHKKTTPATYSETQLEDFFVYFPYFPTSFSIKSSANYASKHKRALSALNYEYSYSNSIEVTFVVFFTNDKSGTQVTGIDNSEKNFDYVIGTKEIQDKKTKQKIRTDIKNRVYFKLAEQNFQVNTVAENLRILRQWTNPAFYDLQYVREPPYVELCNAGINIRGRILSLKNDVVLYKKGVPVRCYTTITLRGEPTSIVSSSSGKDLEYFFVEVDKATVAKYSDVYNKQNKLLWQGTQTRITTGEGKQGFVQRTVNKVKDIIKK